ncbi:MAG: hypothetical protein LKF99_05395 [Bifidobacterium sp.]|jgi:IS30 family transposase|nr:hypothetical protein [Bifidobacterium sp.]
MRAPDCAWTRPRASTISREIARNTNPATGMYEPYRAQQMSADRLKRLKTAKVYTVRGLLACIKAGLRAHWSPEQIAAGSGQTSPIIRA